MRMDIVNPNTTDMKSINLYIMNSVNAEAIDITKKPLHIPLI